MALAAAWPSTWARAGRNPLGALGVLLVMGALLWRLGPIGLVPGALIALFWLGLPAPYAVAAGSLLLLPVLVDPPIGILFVVTTGFLAVLGAPFLDGREPVRSVALLLGLGLAGAGLAWFGWATWVPRWLVGVALVGLIGLGLYGLHRYSILVVDDHAAGERA